MFLDEPISPAPLAQLREMIKSGLTQVLNIHGFGLLLRSDRSLAELIFREGNIARL